MGTYSLQSICTQSRNKGENVSICGGNIFQGSALCGIEVSCKIPGPNANPKAVSEEASMLSLLDVHARRSLVSLERERIC